MEVFALCTVSPHLMFGQQYWKSEHTPNKIMFSQQELMTIPENLNSTNLPAVSRNNINLNPRIFIYSSVNEIYQHWSKTFSGNIKQGLPANSTFAAITNEFYVLILKHIQELHNVKSYICRQCNGLLYSHWSKQFVRQLKTEGLSHVNNISCLTLWIIGS
jgi:hypothetical protein